MLSASLMMTPIWLTSRLHLNQEDYDINTNLRHHNAKESEKALILDVMIYRNERHLSQAY